MLRDEGRTQEALHYAQLAYAKSQEHRITHLFAHLRDETGDYQGAINLYQSLVIDEPLFILGSIANCYYRLQEYKECIRFVVKAILIDTLNRKLWGNLVLAAAKLGKQELKETSLDIHWFLAESSAVPDESTIAQIKEEVLAALSYEFDEEFVKSIL